MLYRLSYFRITEDKDSSFFRFFNSSPPKKELSHDFFQRREIFRILQLAAFGRIEVL